MNYLPSTLEILAKYGSHLIIDGDKMLPAAIEKIVEIIGENNGHITIRTSIALPSSLEQYISKYPKNVTLDLSKIVD